VADEEVPYEVGYGKPPRARRFQKGVSGNPKGRPKGTRNLATIVQKESRQQVRVNGPHGVRTVTKLEAVVMQLTNKSAQGDPRATRVLIPLIERSEESIAAGAAPLSSNDLDQKVLQNLRRRLSSCQPKTDASEEGNS
jgi:hypothetical protein